MGRSNDFRDVIQNDVEPAAYQKENQEEKGASIDAPEFQMKMDPVQKQPIEEEEEMLQPKMNPVQKQEEEEEEMLQPKMNPVQKQEEEEEEMLQPKMNPVQKQEEEEEEMLQPKMNPVQKQPMEEEEEMLQPKMNPVQKQEEEEESAMLKRSNKKAYQLKAKEVESASVGFSSKLPAQLKENMEHSLGGDFSNTEIYTNSSKAEKMNALAFAQGDEIHFAPGKYDPESKKGKELIGHELTHIVQQKKGVVQKTKNDNGMRVNNEFKLEKEADDLGKKAADSSFEDAPRKHDQSYEQFIAEQPTENNT